MKHWVVSMSLVIGIFLSSAPSSAESPTAEEEISQGVKAFRDAQFDDAIAHFKTAIEANPRLLNARLYLATAYSEKYVPGSDTPKNLQMGNQAIEQYKIIMESKDPLPATAQKTNSIKAVAGLYLQMKKFDEARQYYRQAIELDPEDPEGYYSIGVIDWTLAYQPRMELREKLKMKPVDESLIHNPACWQLKSQNEATVKEGIDHLAQALKLRPDYDDAMAYMNLMFRERADIQCGDEKAYNADLKAADSWVDLNMGTKKAKAAKEAPAAAQGDTGVR